MREKTRRRMMVALGADPLHVDDEMRRKVEIFKLNGLPDERIAEHMALSLGELRWYFSRELQLSTEQILADSARRMVALAAQTEDLGVAYRANEMILKTRLKVWREPKADESATDELGRKRVEQMSLSELEQELERLDREAARRSSSDDNDSPGESGPH